MPDYRWLTRSIFAFATIAVVLTGCAKTNETINTPPKDESTVRFAYPISEKLDVTDDYHGTVVADPYRWLEDLDSPETVAWVKEQNDITFDYLHAIPERAALLKRLKTVWNYPRYGIPVVREGKYFYTHNDGLQNQSPLYVADSLDDEPRLLLDPNQLDDDGTTALDDWVVSDDGKLVAYGLQMDGSDWRQWRILDVATGETLDDHLRWIKFSGVAWTPDSQGFYYSRYDEPDQQEEFTGINYFQKLYYHKLGDPQSKDRLIYERSDQKEWGFDAHVTEDGNYLVITVWRGTERTHQVFIQDLTEPQSQVREIITGFDADYGLIGNDGTTLWFQTDNSAPRHRVIAIDLQNPARDKWRELIPESEETLRNVSHVGGIFIASYLKDAHSVVRLFAEDGTSRGEIELPGIGSAYGFGGRADATETFYSFTNFTTPGSIYRYDVASATSSVFRQPNVDFDSDDYETQQVFFASKDGTKIPMFITSRRGVKLGGNNPTLLYAYGGFNISKTPSFSIENLVWMEQGGIYAMPNLRGGGEYGRPWHEAGMKEKKQNVFDDFQAAAEYLIEQKYTSPEKLAIRGGSNGGLLVGACMTQRPELYRAAIPAVGVMDMLRYHKFTIGWAWVSEYGSADDPDEFKTLLAYSPLHNIKPGTCYPATLVTTADHDDRVVPGHSYKFAATLQAVQACDHPTLIRIETSAGHGAGTPTSKQIEAAADRLAFLVDQLGVSDDRSKK